MGHPHEAVDSACKNAYLSELSTSAALGLARYHSGDNRRAVTPYFRKGLEFCNQLLHSIQLLSEPDPSIASLSKPKRESIQHFSNYLSSHYKRHQISAIKKQAQEIKQSLTDILSGRNELPEDKVFTYRAFFYKLGIPILESAISFWDKRDEDKFIRR